jgi:hypothetical protein
MKGEDMAPEEIDKEISDIMRWPTDADFVFMKCIKDAPEFVKRIRTGYVLMKADRENQPIMLRHIQSNNLLWFESLRDMIGKGWIVD